MLQSFVIVSREGLESFLIVAITLAYLRKTGQKGLVPSVYFGIGASILASAIMGYFLIQVANQALWEAIIGFVAVIMVGSLVIHMWRIGPRLKQNMERQLEKISVNRTGTLAAFGVFLFTLLMITREGMETALMLFQVKSGSIYGGAALGLAAAVFIAWLWNRAGHLVNLKRFFQVTGVFLILFMMQIGVHSFHELCEANVLPNSEALHAATEPYSADGPYGKVFSIFMVVTIGVWLGAAAIIDKIRARKRTEKLLDRAEKLHDRTIQST